MLKSRVLTAVILLLIIIAMMWLLQPPVFATVISIFFIISADEWTRLIGVKQIFWRIAYTVLVVAAIGVAYFLPPQPVFYAALLLWLWAAAAVYAYQRDGVSLLGFQNAWVKALAGILMLVACWKSLVWLQTASPLWLLLALCLCWLVDTGAYFCGRRWGRHALAARISPKKTWEGFWGGIVIAVVVIAAGSLLLPLTFKQRGLLLLLVLFCAFLAVVGDLFVSVLKRQAGVKDSGSLLPGHGGLLDRVDSAISAAPLFALGLLLLKL